MSADFWYSDGNVVVSVGNRLYKLHQSRLAKYSLYFASLFSEGTTKMPHASVDGACVYHAPAGLLFEDFERFLVEVEEPS